MYHPHEITNNSVLSFSKENQDNSLYDVHVEPSRQSLLAVLDDKNKIISDLKKQLQNQKTQLAYYIKKELSPKRIEKFSESCTPEASEESMALKLAVTNFNRQMGIKSNILSLYERMCYIDERISSSLEDQEFILRKLVNKLCEFVKHANGNIEFTMQFSNFITDPFHIELFNKLLNATINLRKKLDVFRICCNRLIVIEDERNAIVEQIYTLPVDQRMNYSYLVSIQAEKMQLENELQQIIKDQRKDQERMKDLNVIEEKLSSLQLQLNSAIFNCDDGNQLNRMLQKVNSEARILLELTKQQRNKFKHKLARIKEANLTLERISVYLKLALENRKLTPKDLIEHGVTTVEDIKIFECIKKQIDCSKNNYKGKLFEELEAKRWEVEVLKSKLSQVSFEMNELKLANQQHKRTMSDMRFNQEMDLSSLREERDMYKKQVNDLEAIREAYAQLVHKQPAFSQNDREYLEEIRYRDNQIYDLEKINRELLMELKTIKNIVNKQNREIKQQTKTIEDMKQYNRNPNVSPEKNLEYVFKNKNSNMTDSLRDIKEHHNTISYVELYQEEVYVQEKVVNYLGDSGEPLQHTSRLVISPSKQSQCTFDGKCKSVTYSSVSKENNEVKERKRSIACIKVFSSRRGQGADVTQTVMSTNMEDVRGNVKKEKSSMICIRENNKVKLEDTDISDLDEFELMKDSSQESLPYVCPSKKKKKPWHGFRIISDQLEY